MTWLSAILAFKIGVTALLVAAPLLLWPARRAAAAFHVDPDAAPLLRLYGVAVSALLIGYASGFPTIAAGVFPWGVVIMGIASNAGATAALVATGAARRAPGGAWLFGAIAAALTACAAFPEQSIRPLF